MTPKYAVTYHENWSGITQHSFAVDGKLIFKAKTFYSEIHARREALEHLAARDIYVELEDIGVVWDGCMG